jgi:hypothetical protein
MDFGFKFNMGIYMKYILSIATVAAVVGASFFFSEQANDKQEVGEQNNQITETVLETAEVTSSEIKEEIKVEKTDSDIAKKQVVVKTEITPSQKIPNKKNKKIKIANIKQKIEKKIVTDAVVTQQAAINTTELKIENNESKSKVGKFSQILDVSMNTDTKETSNQEKGYDTQIWYFLSYQMTEEYKARLWIDITKDLADSYEEKLQNTKVTFSKKGIKFGEKLTYTPSVTTVIPTSEKSKRNEELIVGLEVNTSLSYALNDSLSFSYNPRVGKNFHEYETSRTNKTNTSYKLVQFAGLSYDITDKYSAGTTLIQSNTWSYKGTRRNPSYLFITSLGYQAMKDLSLSIGTLQGGSLVQRENGPDGNIEIYDENETTYYGNFSLSF